MDFEVKMVPVVNTRKSLEDFTYQGQFYKLLVDTEVMVPEGVSHALKDALANDPFAAAN